MSYDFSLLTHIQLKKKIKTPRALVQLEGMHFSEAGEKILNSLSSLLPSPPIQLGYCCDYRGNLRNVSHHATWQGHRLGVGSEVSGYYLISSRFGLIKISHPLMHGTQNNPNHLHHNWFLTINQTASLKSSGSWGFAAGIKSLLTVWQAWP